MIIFSIITATLCVFVATVHSFLSERVILSPLYKENQTGLLAAKAMRDIIRAVFHIPSVAWSIIGIAVLLNRLQDGNNLMPIIAATILGLSGIMNLAALKRPHPGGIILCLAAIASITDLLTH